MVVLAHAVKPPFCTGEATSEYPLVMPQIAAAVVWPRIQSFPTNLLMAFFLASLSYYLIEKPMIEVGRRLAERSDRLMAWQT